jgi:hypothetical protein
MSVKVIRALLVSAAAVTAKVPADRIVAGVVKEDAPLPALGVTEVGSVPVGAIDGQAAPTWRTTQATSSRASISRSRTTNRTSSISVINPSPQSIRLRAFLLP